MMDDPKKGFRSDLTATATRVTLPSGAEILVVDIELACERCGTQRYRVVGHHLRMLRDALVEMIELHPTLSGSDEAHRVVERAWGTEPSGDPTLN